MSINRRSGQQPALAVDGSGDISRPYKAGNSLCVAAAVAAAGGKSASSINNSKIDQAEQEPARPSRPIDKLSAHFRGSC